MNAHFASSLGLVRSKARFLAEATTSFAPPAVSESAADALFAPALALVADKRASSAPSATSERHADALFAPARALLADRARFVADKRTSIAPS